MSELRDELALIGLADKLAELEKRIRALEQSKEAELMTDNTQELSEIIREMRYRVLEDNGLTVNGLTTIEQEAKQAILDWHNKLVVAELEELLGHQDHEGHLVEPTSNSVIDRINKLKESNDG